MFRFIDFLLLPIRIALMPFYIAPLVGAAIIGAGASLLNGFAQWRTNQQNVEAQERINSQNLAFQREQFEEQKYLNRNQYQLTASDMQKAGMNPILMSGANLTAGNYNSELQAPKAIAPQIDLGAISQLASVYSQNKTQKQIAEDSNKTQKEIADSKNETDYKIAELQTQTQQNMLNQRLTQEDRQFQKKLLQDFSIANIQGELQKRGIESNEAIEKAKRVQEELKRNDDYMKAMKEYEIESKKLEHEKDKTKREIRQKYVNSLLNFAGTIFNGVVNAASRIGAAQKLNGN